jgi:hypothetical protein
MELVKSIQNKKAVGFDPPTALNWKTDAINPRANLSPDNKKRSCARIDYSSFFDL